MRSSSAGACAALLAASCLGAGEGPAPPHPESIEPSSGFAAFATHVVIRGNGFLARPTGEQSGDGAALDTRHRAWLSGVELADVVWRDSRTIEATVPAGLTVGLKRLVVENAYGRQGALDHAYAVITSPQATLEASLDVTPATFNVGQTATVTLTVRNAGGAAALDVVPDALAVTGDAAAGATAEGPVPASRARLEPGEIAVFTWSAVAAAPGALAFATVARGVDEVSALPVASPAGEAPASVQLPAALTAAVAASRTTANVGQPVAVTLTLTNGGAARADLTAAIPQTQGPAASCGAVTPAMPQSVEAGATLTLAWSCTGSAPGTLALSATVEGTDGTSGALLSVGPASPAQVTIQTPAALSAAVAVTGSPITVPVGTSLAVTLTIADTGQAGASVTLVEPSVNPPAAATCSAPSPSPPQAVAGLQSITFSWSCTALAVGSFTLGATAGATDANTGEAFEEVASGVTLTAQFPAVLTATIAASRSVANVGQPLALVFTLINGGTATAEISAVAPAVSGTAAASCGPVTPATASVPGGGVRAFGFTCTASAPGSLSVTATASGTDGVTSTPISATPAAPAAVTIQRPAALAATSFVSSRSVAVTGQQVDVTLVLANSGEAPADLATLAPWVNPSSGASCTAAAPALPQRIAGGTSLPFSWSCTGTAAGSYALGVTVSATDANTGQVLAPAPATLPLAVLTPATLSVGSFAASRAAADVGQAVTVTLQLSNGGGAAATVNAVVPSMSPAATPGCGAPSPAVPQSLPGGGTLTFTWSCAASAAQAYALGAAISAVDAVTGAPRSASAGPLALAVQNPATLTAAIAVAAGSPLVVGEPVGVTLTVSNAGGAAAEVKAVTPSASGSGATCTAPAPGLPVTLAGGASTTFAWTCTPSGPGTLTLGASVAGEDVNTGASLPAAAAPVSRTVAYAASLVIAAFTASRSTANTGQAVTLALTVSNGGGTAATVTAVTRSLEPASTPGCTAPSPAAPQALAPGANLTFTWTCTASTARSYTLGASVAATDDVTDDPLSVTATPLPLTVQQPASVQASIAVGATNPVVAGQPVGVTLTVSNGGGATANLSTVTASATGSAGGSCTAPTPALPPTLAGSASVQASWTCTPAAAGTIVLGASVTGSDTNTGASLEDAAPTVTRTVVAAAGLAVTAFGSSRSVANTGQAVTVTLTLTNGGGTTAIVNAVAPTIGTGASCTVPTPSTPRSIPDGDSRTFTWTCTASLPGTYTLGAAVSGEDSVTGAPLAATAGPLGLTAQSPALLVASIAGGGPDTIVLGQAVGLTLTVTNAGGATANLTEVTATRSGAAATCTAPSPAVLPPLAGGASAVFTWTCTPSHVGSLVLNAAVKATDANTNAAQEIDAAPGVARTVISGTTLAVASFTAGESVVNTGEAVTVSLTVSNAGQNAGALTSVARDMTPSGTSSCTSVQPAAPVPVPAGGSVTLGWTCTATEAGSYALVVTIAATDAAGDPVPLSASPIPITVQAPAQLAPATIQASRTTADVGQAVSVSLVLVNGGQAGANVSAVTTGASGTGAAGCTDPAPAAPFTIADGASVTLSWTCTGSDDGSVTLTAAVTASDANTGGGLTVAITGAPVEIQTAAAVAATLGAAASVAVNVPVDVTLVLENGGGASAKVTAVTPTVDPASASCTEPLPAVPQTIAGGGSVTFTWTCTGTAAGPHTLGATVAARAVNTDASLPVTVAPAAVGVTEAPSGGEVVLVAVDPLGDGTADPLLGESGGAAWVGPGEDGRTLAWLDPAGVEAPVLRDSLAGPSVAPEASTLVGAASGSVAFVAAPEAGDRAAGLTALASVEGIPYAAGPGGILRAAVPGDGAAAWVDVTPVDPAWAARAAVAVAPPPSAESWPARDRAVAAVVPFGACGVGPCVFAGRNVVGAAGEPEVSAQLWRCAPSAGPGACRPADWRLAAPDADAPLTRLGDPESAAVTLLAATPRWLYVGFDAPGGVRLFRSAAGTRFLGRAGCAAGEPGCAGLGGAGFGDGRVVRILRASVLTVDGVPSLWIVAGDGVGPARVYRVED